MACHQAAFRVSPPQAQAWDEPSMAKGLLWKASSLTYAEWSLGTSRCLTGSTFLGLNEQLWGRRQEHLGVELSDHLGGGVAWRNEPGLGVI